MESIKGPCHSPLWKFGTDALNAPSDFFSIYQDVIEVNNNKVSNKRIKYMFDATILFNSFIHI
jgi:hypothetical protein